MIDQLTISRLEATPIEGVAERLGMRVERHKAICPWHEDSRPSLTFNTYKNRYRCYVCDAHGGVIDLVRGVRGCSFPEACEFLGYCSADSRPTKTGYRPSLAEAAPPVSSGGCSASTVFLGSLSATQEPPVGLAQIQSAAKKRNVYPPDIEWLSSLVRVKNLIPEARRFLFEERKIDPRVVQWCGLTSIAQPAPCWRYGKPFYDAPSLLIPYYDVDGRLVSVQGRYLGKPNTASGENVPRFRFPRGSDCHVYGLQILRMLRPGEELWITEGASDCWAMLSAGHKAIAIPSATLLKDKDIEPLKGLNLHMYPDQDRPGEKLFLELRNRLPQLERHQLPAGCKDYGAYYAQMIAQKG